VQTIPVGVELKEFPRRQSEPNRKSVGFAGRLTWGANEDAVNWLAREIAPKVLQAHPDASFRVIGPGGEGLHEKYEGPRFQFTGYVASMGESLADLAVGVVPVLSGTGMRLKLLELLSVGVPTVTTSLGAAGLDCVHREHVLIADDTDSFAGAVSELLSDAALRERLSQKGSELAKQYSWDGIEEKVRELVKDTMLAAGKALPVQLEPIKASH
jgi:glycosyltransferase involved in cell wall biosynthesis